MNRLFVCDLTYAVHRDGKIMKLIFSHVANFTATE